MAKFNEDDTVWIDEYESNGKILEVFEDDSGFSNSYVVLIETEGIEYNFFEHELSDV